MPAVQMAIFPAPQPVRQAQSLGLGIPPVIRQSDSVRRQVMPIPSGQFCTPPILDHNSDSSSLSNETPLSPNPPTPTDQPPAPSKRGKTRGSKTSKASGSHGSGRQWAKAGATATIVEWFGTVSGTCIFLMPKKLSCSSHNLCISAAASVSTFRIK